LSAAGIATLGTLAACSPQVASTDDTPANNATAGDTAVEGAAWRSPTAPVTADEITATHSNDVVVVGAGHAGIAAARKVAEEGKSVILLNKWPEGSHMAIGNAAGALNSTYLLDKGIDPIDPIEFYNNWQLNTNNGGRSVCLWKLHRRPFWGRLFLSNIRCITGYRHDLRSRSR
jgi:hypothetical protein